MTKLSVDKEKSNKPGHYYCIDAVTQNLHMTSQMYIILCTVSHLLFLNTSTLAPQLSYSIHDVKQTKTYKDDCYNTFKKYT